MYFPLFFSILNSQVSLNLVPPHIAKMFSLSSFLLLTISIALTLLLQPFLTDAQPAPTPAALIENAVAIRADAATSTPAGNITFSLLEVLELLPRSAAPANASAIVSAVAQAAPTSIPEATDEFEQVVKSGVLIYSVEEIIDSATPPPASVHPRNPQPPIYPDKSPKDAPYSLKETHLRSVIDIPSTFTYGKKHPVIIVPGTASTTNMTYANNLFKTLANSSFADIVWINNPGLALEDAQVNSEYVAYAINYISGITGNEKVSVIAWSQGTSNTQWALKYWPSTRDVVKDFIALSPEFHGSKVSTLICESLGCSPGFYQQTYKSNWIAALRSDGGDSAYVPTTTIYSSHDQIISPQSGTDASGYLGDANGVKVTNNEVQLVCPNQPAGSDYTHEGILFNPLTHALIKDALKNGGPGNMSRIGYGLCADYADPRLSVHDVLATESVSVVQTYNLFTYPNNVFKEPPLMSYAK